MGAGQGEALERVLDGRGLERGGSVAGVAAGGVAGGGVVGVGGGRVVGQVAPGARAVWLGGTAARVA